MSETTEPDGLRKLIESYSQQLNSTNVMYDDEFEAAIRQYFAASLPEKDTRKHALPGADEYIQIGFNAAIDECRRAILKEDNHASENRQ